MRTFAAYYYPSYNDRTLNQLMNLYEGMMGLQTVTKHVNRYHAGSNVVLLAPDLAAF